MSRRLNQFTLLRKEIINDSRQMTRRTRRTIFLPAKKYEPSGKSTGTSPNATCSRNHPRQLPNHKASPTREHEASVNRNNNDTSPNVGKPQAPEIRTEVPLPPPYRPLNRAARWNLRALARGSYVSANKSAHRRAANRLRAERSRAFRERRAGAKTSRGQKRAPSLASARNTEMRRRRWARGRQSWILDFLRRGIVVVVVVVAAATACITARESLIERPVPRGAGLFGQRRGFFSLGARGLERSKLLGSLWGKNVWVL